MPGDTFDLLLQALPLIVVLILALVLTKPDGTAPTDLTASSKKG